MPAPTSVTNNNQNQPITVNGTYCTIQVPGWMPPAMSPGGMSQAQFGTVQYSITAGSTGVGTVVTYQAQMADGVFRTLVTPAPITLANSQIYTGTIPFPIGACQIVVSGLVGNGIAQASLTGYEQPLYLVTGTTLYIPPVNPPPVNPPPQPPPTQPPPSNPPPNVPAAASAAGLNTLIFSDEFNTPLDCGFSTGSRTGHKWTAGTWYDYPGSQTPAYFSVANSILTITADPNNWRELCTQWHNFQGGTYFSGTYYAEAMMMCTDWSAFWFYPAGAPYTVFNAGDQTTWNGEIDVIECDQSTPGFANKMTTTIHVNTGGPQTGYGGQAFYTMPNSGTPFGQWHTYAILMQPGINTATFYCDNVQMGTMPTGTSNYRPMTMLLQAAPGNVNQGLGGATAIEPPTTQVDWVRVWMAAPPPVVWLMAQVVGNHVYQNGAVSVSMDVNTTSGNTLIVVSTRPGGVVSNITISGGSANFVKLVGVLDTAGTVSNEIWYATNITGGILPTISVFMPHGGDVTVYEVNPGGPAPVPDGSNFARGTGTTASVSMTTTATNDLLIKLIDFDGSYDYSTQGVWVELVTDNTNVIGYQVGATIGSYTGTGNQKTSATWTAVIAALKI